MRSVQFRSPYSFSSIGGLMDPEFLRRAVNDMAASTNTEPHDDLSARKRFWERRDLAQVWSQLFPPH